MAKIVGRSCRMGLPSHNAAGVASVAKRASFTIVDAASKARSHAKVRSQIVKAHVTMELSVLIVRPCAFDL